MPEKKNQIRRETLVEKIVRRSLETVGGSVDNAFGRGKKPDALPATSDLSERLRKMIDRQAQINKDGRKLAPHIISLKYAWGQTSDEFQVALKRLKNELLIVAIDFINDNRFATLAPVKIEAKADILIVGFTMSIGFDEASLRDAEQVEIPVEIYAQLLPDYQADLPPAPHSIAVKATATFPSGGTRSAVLNFVPEKKTTLTVGRIKETDLYLDDDSVSKHHASLVMNAEGVLRVADIGSTNGTFLHGARIAYGKAYEIEPLAVVGFGDVTAVFEWEVQQPEPEPETIESGMLLNLSENISDENNGMTETTESGIKIRVKSATLDSEEDEDATVFGAANNSFESEPEELAIINRTVSEKQPKTINQQFKDEPEPVNQQNVGKIETVEILNAKSKINSLAAIDLSVNQMSETGQLTDFTQSLKPNSLDQSMENEESFDFNNLPQKSNQSSEEINEFDEDKSQQLEKS